jgi:pimeloyl-ACP methyl ester carboxylesterase
VLVHGAWSGPWVWDEVRRYLGLARIASVTVALPSVGEDTGKLGGLHDDAAGISAVLDELSGPFVLVGHSYSGVPVTEVAATREDVTHVVYMCGFAMPVGTSMLDALGGQPPEWWIFGEDGESIMPDNPRAIRMSRQTARRVAREHDWDTLRDAEYLAVTRLQADALVTVDPELAAVARDSVPLAAVEDLLPRE